MRHANYPIYTWPDEYSFSRGVHQIVNFAVQTYKTVNTWRSRARQRRRLSQFDSRLLDDIGVSRADARVEAAKPFWKA